MEDLLKEIKQLRSEISWRGETVDSIIASCVPAIIVDLENGLIVKSTALADSLFGYIEGELEGKTIYDLIPERFHSTHLKHVSEYSKKPVPRSMGERDMELFGRMKDGNEIGIEIGLHPRAITGKRFVIATILKRRK